MVKMSQLSAILTIYQNLL